MQPQNIFSLNAWHRFLPNKQLICISKSYKKNIYVEINLRVNRFLGITIAEMAGEPIIQYNDISCPSGEILNDFRKHVLAELKQQKISLLLLRNVRKNSKLFYLCEHISEIVASKKAPFIRTKPLTSIDDYLMTLSATTRKSKRRAIKKINKDFETKFEILKNEEIDPSLIELALDLKKKQLLEYGATSRLFTTPKELQRFLKIITTPNKGFDLVLSKLSCDDKISALEIGFLYDGIYYSFLGTIDEAYKKYSVGSVQLIHTIEWAIESDIEQFDFLAPQDGYKFSWCGNQYMPALDLAINVDLLGSIYSKLYLKKLRPLLKQIYFKIKSQS